MSSAGSRALLRSTDEVRDQQELEEAALRRRTDFETALRSKRGDLRQWMRYARFEAVEMHEMGRARAIFERALSVPGGREWVPLWLRYADTEMLAQNFSRARNVLFRATEQLPRISRLWLAAAALDERLEKLEDANHVFERWMKWLPGPTGWLAYLGFARRTLVVKPLIVAQMFVSAHPQNLMAWKAWATESVNPRSIWVQAADSAESNDLKSQILNAWAEWEQSQNEPERAAKLRELADPSQKSAAKVAFERYVTANPYDYDAWWALATEDPSTLESALQHHPPPKSPPAVYEKYSWLWLRYAVSIELQEGASAARKVLERATAAVPKSTELWRHRAALEVRQQNLKAMRSTFGSALGITGHDPIIYKDYILFERQLRSTERVRKLCAQFCQRWPLLSEAWTIFADFEADVGDDVRAQAIWRMATQFVPELWKVWADREADAGHFDAARDVFLLWQSNTNDPDAFVEHAMFEVSTGLDDTGDEVDAPAIDRARRVICRGHRELTGDARVRLYDAELQFEQVYGSDLSLDAVEARAPLVNGDTIEFPQDDERQPYSVEEQSIEEQSDQERSDENQSIGSQEAPAVDVSASAIQRLLANAHKWKKKTLTEPNTSEKNNSASGL